MIDSSGLFARTRRTAGGAGSKPVCTDRLPQPECHRRTGQSDQPAAGGTETVNRSGRFVAYQRYQPDFSLRPGQKAVDALAGQSAKLLNGIPIDEEDFFGRQLAFNMLPLLPDSEGSVREERRIVDEVRKILQDEGLMISASVVQHRYSTVMPRWSTLKHCVRWQQKKRVMRLLRAKILCSLKRTNSRLRWGCFWYAASFRWLRT